MKARVEILSGIVRVGPQMDGYGDPFEFAVAFSADEGVAHLKGLVADRRFTLRHAAAIRRALRQVGLRLDFRRVEEKG